jgi:hypothetical protein
MAVICGYRSSVTSKADAVADWIASGSLLISVASLFVSWRSGRRIRVYIEGVQSGGHLWLSAIVRNPGGAPAQITAWGFRANNHFIGRYKELSCNTSGSQILGAPSALPCELAPAAHIRLSWETAEISKQYRAQYSSAPTWFRAYVKVGWKKASIKSRVPRKAS